VTTYRDFIAALRTLEIPHYRPVIAHASLSAFGLVHGGEQTILGAVLAAFDTVIMPAFTYKTMIVPELGPPGNGLAYGKWKDANRMAEFFCPQMPVDTLMGAVAEAMRSHPRAERSDHPILSFCGVNAHFILETQKIDQPFAPIHKLRENRGWVLLVGVDHTVNTSLHYAEWIAGRKQFVRWALTPMGAVACPNFPGCSQGFQAIAPRLERVTRSTTVGKGLIQAIPLNELVDAVIGWLTVDPLALLCARPDCELCAAVRMHNAH